ncbi:hypothetical protein SLS60_007870 [Paraconiothyrium brasiliense]|uniref:Uncharacterized protein n=1 Tax=Paraconiothyrium brasiliense TaxID=300254 RepID=A0ABR3R2R8_9PLEO
MPSGLSVDKGISGTAKLLTKFRSDSPANPSDNKGDNKGDPWGWTQKFKKYKSDHGKIGGTRYDITNMSRKERAGYAFDKKDPLQAFSAKDIKEGNLDIQ